LERALQTKHECSLDTMNQFVVDIGGWPDSRDNRSRDDEISDVSLHAHRARAVLRYGEKHLVVKCLHIPSVQDAHDAAGVGRYDECLLSSGSFITNRVKMRPDKFDRIVGDPINNN